MSTKQKLEEIVEGSVAEYLDANEDLLFIPDEVNEIINIVKTETDVDLMKMRITKLMLEFTLKAQDRFGSQ